MKWKLYWSTLAAVLFGTSLWRNSRKYTERSKAWVAGKSLADVIVSVLCCWLFPPLIIAFTTIWSLRYVKEDRVWQTVAGVAIGSILAWISFKALEILALFGVLSADFLTEKLFDESEDAIRDRRWGRMPFRIREDTA